MLFFSVSPFFIVSCVPFRNRRFVLLARSRWDDVAFIFTWAFIRQSFYFSSRRSTRMQDLILVKNEAFRVKKALECNFAFSFDKSWRIFIDLRILNIAAVKPVKNLSLPHVADNHRRAAVRTSIFGSGALALWSFPRVVRPWSKTRDIAPPRRSTNSPQTNTGIGVPPTVLRGGSGDACCLVLKRYIFQPARSFLAHTKNNTCKMSTDFVPPKVFCKCCASGSQPFQTCGTQLWIHSNLL